MASNDMWLTSGDVGIGSTSPAAALDVNGKIANPALSCEAIDMGATAKPAPDLYTDGIAFAERTGRLTDWRELLQSTPSL